MKLIRILAGCFLTLAIVGIVGLSVGMDYGDMSQRNITASGTITGATAHITGATTLDSQMVLNGTTLTDTPSAAHGNVSQPVFIAKTSNGVVTNEIRAPISTGSTIIGKDAGIGSYGGFNTIYGYEAGYSQQGREYNTFIGYQAGYYANSASDSGGNYNVFVGNLTGQGSSTPANNTGQYNTAIGDHAYNSFTSGTSCCALGQAALYANTTGSYNVGFGQRAGRSNTTGSNNVFIGGMAGRYSGSNPASLTEMTSVDSGVYIGYNSHGSAATGVTNEIAIGASSVGKGSNTITLGSSSTTMTYIPYGGLAVDSPTLYVDAVNNRVSLGTASPGYQLELSTNSAAKPTSEHWTTTSDARLKQDIRDIDSPLDTLLQLKGRKYKWKPSERSKHKHGSTDKIGFIAQEVETVFPEWVDTTSDGTKNLTTAGIDALLIEAIRELKTENEALKKRIEVLEAK